jgi:CheY-like chemotaxis protein
MQLLLVEDEVAIRDRMRDALEGAGYNVVVAADGLEAIHRLAECRPFVVILDLILPLLSGSEVYQTMQNTPELEDVPVVITTSDSTESPAGVPTLAKPVDLEVLLRMVARLAQGHDPVRKAV